LKNLVSSILSPESSEKFVVEGSIGGFDEAGRVLGESQTLKWGECSLLAGGFLLFYLPVS
jgi:hypothetical protein